MYLDIIESLCLKPIKTAEFIFHDEHLFMFVGYNYVYVKDPFRWKEICKGKLGIF